MGFRRNYFYLTLISYVLVGQPLACLAEGSRDEAFRYFTQGKALYQEQDFKGAEERFILSLREVVDQQSLYYKALAITKQADRCADQRAAWRAYFTFCERADSACPSAWIAKARSHISRVEERCRRPVTLGAPSQESCRNGLVQPDGSCRPRPSPLSITAPNQARPVERGSFLKSLPWWFYVSAAAGALSHVVNVNSEDADTLDLTYFSAIAGYAISGIGLGYGVIQHLKAPDQRSGASTLSSGSQAQLERLLPRVSGLSLQVTF